jgi:archaellum component FlaG (FlaF/FlaG flagellin family)
MRLACAIGAVMALFLTTPVFAQSWGEYINRDDFFTVNFPGDPVIKETPYKTAKGTNLTAHVYTANAGPDSILAGEYSMTVVDYANAPSEAGTAIQEAADAIRKEGEVKYDDTGNVDRIKTQRITVNTPGGNRILAEILVHTNRLYIVKANVSQKVPPPAQFQASVQILDKDGVRIRYEQDGVTRVR